MKGKIFALRKVFGTLLVSITFALTCGAALPLQAFAQEQEAKAPSSSHNAVVLLLDDSASMTPQSRESLKEAAKRIGKGILESDVKARVAIVLCGRSNAVLPFTGEFDSVKSFVDARVSGTGNTGVDAGAGLQSADTTAKRLEGGPSDVYVKSIVAISDGASVSGDSAQRQVRSLASTYRIYSLGLSGSAASAVESLKQIQNAGYFEEKDLNVLERHVVECATKSLTSAETSANHQGGLPDQSALDKLTGDHSGFIVALGPVNTGGNAPENGSGTSDQGKGSGGDAGDNASKAPSAPEEGSNSADASTPGAPTDDGSTPAAPVPDGNAPFGNNAPSAPTGPGESTSGAGNAAPKGTLSQTNSSGNGAAGSNDAEGENVRNRFVNSADNRDDDDGRDPDPDPTPISDSVPDGKKATGGNSGKSHLPQTSDPSSTLATLPFSLGVLSIASGLFLRRRDDHEDAING